MSEEKWIVDWFKDNEPTLSKMKDALRNRDREAFIAAAPKEVFGHHYYKDNNVPEDARCIVVYTTSGYSGGNCWGGEPRYFSNDEYPEGGFTGVLVGNLLDAVASETTMVSAAKIVTEILNAGRKLDREDSFTDYEYYGNSENISLSYVIGGELYDFIVGMVE